MRAARAFFYWLICDNFGDAPLVTTTTTELPDKAARKEIYDFIVAELTAAMPDLSVETGGRCTGVSTGGRRKLCWPIFTSMPKVYTGEAKWADCLRECNDIIGSNKYSLKRITAMCSPPRTKIPRRSCWPFLSMRTAVALFCGYVLLACRAARQTRHAGNALGFRLRDGHIPVYRHLRPGR